VPATGVMYCIDQLTQGAGTENQLVSLIERLDRSQWQPYLCTIRPANLPLLPADCIHLSLDVPALLRPGTVVQMNQMIRFLHQHDIQIVQTFFQDATAFCGIAARLAGVPVRLASFRDLGFWRTRSQEIMLRRVYPHLTGFIANSEAVKQHFCTTDSLAENRVAVIPNGVDTQNYTYTEHNSPAKAVALVGNLNRRVKRADLFIDAAALVRDRHSELSWHIIGDGHLRPEYEKRIAQHRLTDQTIFTGNIKDVASYR